ncbi:MAG: hypothetical protein KF893_25445 [Caldilineaceae bacterium]|nr:hypothetical protein [Caldilineaceae bacterium]
MFPPKPVILPRNQRSHPTYAGPERLATVPNQLWSWDITWMRGRHA